MSRLQLLLVAVSRCVNSCSSCSVLQLRLIGQMELNSNNRSEVLSEAAKLRKGRFMRAMAKQYLTTADSPWPDHHFLLRFEHKFLIRTSTTVRNNVCLVNHTIWTCSVNVWPDDWCYEETEMHVTVTLFQCSCFLEGFEECRHSRINAVMSILARTRAW